MKIHSALLTTYNRPEMLRQSLPAILGQCRDAELDLLICDDGSTDDETREMLASAASRKGVWLTVRNHTDNWHPHLSTGRNFLAGIQELVHRYGEDGAFLKLDDDIILAPRAIGRMIDRWDDLATYLASTRQPEPATLSGIATPFTIFESLAEEVPGVWRTETSTSPCCVHRLDHWIRAVHDIGAQEIIKSGWDTVFFGAWLQKIRPELNHCFTTLPSLVYHAGHTGVHLLETDHNRLPPDPFAFPGEWENGRPVGAVCTAGRLPEWKKTYGRRLVVPAWG